MTAQASNYLSDAIKNSIFRGIAFPSPTSFIFRLSTTQVSADGTGDTEEVGGWYGAVTQTRNGTNFSTSSNGSASSNQSEVDFGTNDAADVFYLYVEDESGNLWFYDNGIGDAGFSVGTGVDIIIPVGNFTYDMDAVTDAATTTVSDFIASGVINAVMTATAFPSITSIKFGFSTNGTKPTAAGANITAPVGTWYSDQTVSTAGGTEFSAPSGGSAISNNNLIQWNSGDPTDEATTLEYLILRDQSDNFLFADAVGSAIDDGNTRVSIAASAFSYDN